MSEVFFISYAHSDATEFVKRLHDELEGFGFMAWLDERDIQPGDNWNAAIEQGLRTCIGLLSIVTLGSIASDVCQDEIVLIHNLKKPIIPLLIAPESDDEPAHFTDFPLLLQRKQYVDFTESFEQGMARLGPQLHRVIALHREINKRSSEIERLEQERATAPRPQALDRYIDDMRETIANKQEVMLEPEAFAESYRRAMQTEIEAQLQNQKRAREEAKSAQRQRVVGSPPQGLTDSFKDRVDERAQVINYLLEDDKDIRVVSIIGKGGVGKTAIASNVLHDLEKDYENVHGIVYLSAARRTDSISLERIFIDTAAMLGMEFREQVEALWTNPKMEMESRFEGLLDHLVDKRCIYLFDNLEDILDDTGRFLDEDLGNFVDTFLRRQHKSRILVTSREPLNPANDVRRHERVLPLKEGLPTEYAIELLRDLDADNELGLYDADDATLAMVSDKTYGFPRALEAVVGLLVNDPMLLLQDVLNDDDLWGREVTEKLVARAQSRLSEEQQLIMQALALFGRPVREAAVRYLLQDYAEHAGLDVSKVLRQLARGRYITVNRSTGKITIHPLDKEYNYRQIQDTAPSPNGKVVFVIIRVDLETRAADYYEQLRGNPEDWKTIDDLEAIIAEFEHRVRAGDYNTAFYLINTIDRDYLRRWGYSRKALDMRQMLVGNLNSDRNEGRNAYQMGPLFDNLGYYHEALESLEKALKIAREEQARKWEGNILSVIGGIYGYLHNFDKSIQYLEDALTIARKVGSLREEAYCLNELALIYRSLGRKSEELDCNKQVLAITRKLENKMDLSVALRNIGDTSRVLGLYNQAKEYYEEALTLSEELLAKADKGICIAKIGLIEVQNRNYDSALKRYQESLQIAIDVGHRRWEVVHLSDIANLYQIRGNNVDAIEFCQRALELAQAIGSSNVLGSVLRTYAWVMLMQNQFEQALDYLKQAEEHTSPSGIYGLNKNMGLAQFRLGLLEDTKNSFTVCLDEAAKRLEDTANLYAPKYARGLALCGLALITGDMSYLDHAKDAYRAAIDNCGAKGIVHQELMNFAVLEGEDHKATLADVRAILEGAM